MQWFSAQRSSAARLGFGVVLGILCAWGAYQWVRLAAVVLGLGE